MALLRAADFDERLWAAVRAAVDRQCALVVDSPKRWTRQISAARVYDHLRSGASSVCLIHGYLLMFSLVEPWFAEPGTRVLYEELVLLIGDRPSNFRRFVHGMEDLARKFGCAGVMVGTALYPSNERLSQAYQCLDYKHESSALYKELSV
ncbi:hypothetical protein ACQUFY_05960 [Robbsia andropogonis]|uniref:hypothetical protein n=1 Tax=Robbsia andropogonis TaxID=28092 RepID=UPI003D1A67E4